MHNYIKFILCFISALLIFPAEANKTDWEKWNLKGKVKEMRKYGMKDTFGEKIKGSLYNIFKFDSNGNLIETQERYDEKFDKCTYQYDTKGNCIEFRWYSIRETLVKKEINHFDGKGNMIETDEYNSDSLLNTKTKYRYNEEGKLTEKCVYRANGSFYYKIIYKYDSNGGKIEECEYDSNGYITTKKIFKRKYNSQKKLVEWSEYDSDTNLKEKSIYEYNNYGNIIKYYRHFRSIEDNSILVEKHTCKYDKLNNLINNNLYILDGILVEKETYKYDSKGNIIEYIKTRNEGEVFAYGYFYEYDYYE